MAPANIDRAGSDQTSIVLCAQIGLDKGFFNALIEVKGCGPSGGEVPAVGVVGTFPECDTANDFWNQKLRSKYPWPCACPRRLIGIPARKAENLCRGQGSCRGDSIDWPYPFSHHAKQLL